VVFPEIDALFGVPQPPQWHPEIDTGVHTLMALEQACLLSGEPQVRFAALLHDLGKGTTPRGQWPRHPGHEERSVALIGTLAQRLRVPADYRDLAVVVARFHGNVHRAQELRPGTILDLFERADALRRPQRFAQALLACEADARGRTGFEDRDYPQRAYLTAAREAAAQVRPAAADIAGGDGTLIAAGLRRDRLAAIAGLRAADESAESAAQDRS
jgi:tRNA nucleotidyltransferase (CCA-adding enzyme)